MEDSFIDYNKRISSMRADGVIQQRSAQMIPPSGRFTIDKTGCYKPVGHPGYTVITPTFEDESANVRTYAKLSDVQDFLLKQLGVDKYVPAPVTGLHLTISDLVAGKTYRDTVQGGNEQKLLQALSSVFNQLTFQWPVRLQVLGLSLFSPGFIIAVVGAVDESGYERLMSLRNVIYDDPPLMHFGIKRKFKFTGHITLAYIEGALSEHERNNIYRTLKAGNESFFVQPMPLEVVRAEVRKFNDMSAFYRQGGWPLFEFA